MKLFSSFSIIFTAEDDESEMHRRIERLDYDNNRSSYEHELRIVSLPNVGGVFPILQETHDGYKTSIEFDKLYEQILQMKDLKLIMKIHLLIVMIYTSY